MTRGALAIVERWQNAVNDGCLERVRACSADRVHVTGPRGTGTIESSELGSWMIRLASRRHRSAGSVELTEQSSSSRQLAGRTPARPGSRLSQLPTPRKDDRETALVALRVRWPWGARTPYPASSGRLSQGRGAAPARRRPGSAARFRWCVLAAGSASVDGGEGYRLRPPAADGAVGRNASMIASSILPELTSPSRSSATVWVQ